MSGKKAGLKFERCSDISATVISATDVSARTFRPRTFRPRTFRPTDISATDISAMEEYILFASAAVSFLDQALARYCHSGISPVNSSDSDSDVIHHFTTLQE